MNNKTVLITGTSSGFGKSAAKFFAANGWNVIATMRSPEKEQELTSSDNMLLLQWMYRMKIQFKRQYNPELKHLVQLMYWLTMQDMQLEVFLNHSAANRSENNLMLMCLV